MGNDLLTNLDRIHTTPLGAERIKQNLGFDIADVIAWSQKNIKTAEHTVHKGKNWYVHVDGFVLTINAHSFTIITAHKEKTEQTRLD
jgi:hypothetical protein